MRYKWGAQFGLDMLHNITLPGTSYQAMLKMTGANIELITEENGGFELMDAVNDNIRGGVSNIAQPYALANNHKVMTPKLPEELERFTEHHAAVRKGLRHEDEWEEEYETWTKKNGFDRSQPMTWIAYVDANSLYPTVMTMKLPVADYNKLDLSEDYATRMAFVHSHVASYHDNNRMGYFVEVTYHVPESLHDQLDFPPVAKKRVTPDELSDYQKTTLTSVYGEGATTGQTAKLVPFLGEHRKVMHHIALLKYYVEEMGVVITEVHRVWSFRQSSWMAST